MPAIFWLNDNLATKIIEYMDADSLLAVEGSISQWRPLIPTRMVALDRAMSFLDGARDKEIMDNLPELKSLKDKIKSERDDLDYNSFCLFENWYVFFSLLRDGTLTIIRVNQAGTNVEYSGKYFNRYHDETHHWRPFPE